MATNVSNTMTSSGMSGVGTAPSTGGVKRLKEDKNIPGQTGGTIKDSEKQLSLKPASKDKEQKSNDKTGG